MKTPILGSAYVARSVNAAANRMVNLFPEVIPEGGAEPAFLSRTPGLRLLQTVGTGPIRGMRVVGDFLYVVSGNKLYKIDPAYVATDIGIVNDSPDPVSMSDNVGVVFRYKDENDVEIVLNGTQLFVSCNGPSYVYDVPTGVFTDNQLKNPEYPDTGNVCYLDGYFVFNEPGTQKIWITSLLDGLVVDPLDFSSAEGSPDGLVGIATDHRELWLFGVNSTEVWYNSGNADFPLERISGAFNEIGCASPYSIAKLDNSLFWLGQDVRGQGIVYRANGYIGQRVSTHAIEWQIQQCGDLSDAVAYTYSQDGHSFYVLTIPGTDTTWVYDVATDAWHERAAFINGEFTRHRSNCQAFFDGIVIVGDYENGKIYALDLETFSDDEDLQKWLRSWRALPTGQNNLKRTAHHSLQLNCEAGVGVVSGEDPKAMLRWSDDGGHTWSNEHWVSMGKMGQYGNRVIWRRLGMTLKLRDRVYEVSGTDPVKIIITGAELNVSGTNA